MAKRFLWIMTGEMHSRKPIWTWGVSGRECWVRMGRVSVVAPGELKYFGVILKERIFGEGEKVFK